MSTTTQNQDSNPRCDVIAPGFRDYPAKLNAIRVCGRRIEVLGTDPARSIFLPISELYRYDSDLFDKLQAASLAGDVERLRALWDQAERFRPDNLPARA